MQEKTSEVAAQRPRTQLWYELKGAHVRQSDAAVIKENNLTATFNNRETNYKWNYIVGKKNYKLGDTRQQYINKLLDNTIIHMNIYGEN